MRTANANAIRPQIPASRGGIPLVLRNWLRAADIHQAALKRAPMLPAWLAVVVVLLDFGLIGLWFRYTRQMPMIPSAMTAVLMYLVRLTIVSVTLVLACRHYRVSAGALGLCPGNAASDFRWSFRICLLGGSGVVAVMMAGLITARWFAIQLPAPPVSLTQLLDGQPPGQFLVLAVFGAVVVVLLAPLTEELLYRSLFLPVLAYRIGLVPAITVSSLVFGWAHVIPMGEVSFPIAEIIGGVVMAAGFAIRWSVISAMVIHAMGNLLAGALMLGYAQLFKACPIWFASQ